MNVLDFINKLLEVLDIPEAQRQETREEMVLTVAMIIMRQVPPPEGSFTEDAGRTVQEIFDDIAVYFSDNEDVRTAVSTYFSQLIEPLREKLSDRQRSELNELFHDAGMVKE